MNVIYYIYTHACKFLGGKYAAHRCHMFGLYQFAENLYLQLIEVSTREFGRWCAFLYIPFKDFGHTLVFNFYAGRGAQHC